MTKYIVIAEMRVHYDIEIRREGFWQYHISRKGKPICSAYALLSEAEAFQAAKEAITDLDEVDYLRYSWRVDDED